MRLKMIQSSLTAIQDATICSAIGYGIALCTHSNPVAGAVFFGTVSLVNKVSTPFFEKIIPQDSIQSVYHLTVLTIGTNIAAGYLAAKHTSELALLVKSAAIKGMAFVGANPFVTAGITLTVLFATLIFSGKE